MRDKVKYNMVKVIGEAAIKVATESVGKSWLHNLYEISVPIELKEELQQKHEK